MGGGIVGLGGVRGLPLPPHVLYLDLISLSSSVMWCQNLNLGGDCMNGYDCELCVWGRGSLGIGECACCGGVGCDGGYSSKLG